MRVFEATSDFAEAQWMVDEMRQLVRDGLARHEIAVLYRSNAQSRVIETALFSAGLPYKVYGGLRFLSGPKSNMRWPTCGCWRTHAMTPVFCAQLISRHAASACAAWSCCKTRRGPAAVRSAMR